MNYLKYLNIKHDYQTNNCLSLIASIYENELHIPWIEERVLFNNFVINDIKDLRKIPISAIYNLKNWSKISLTEIQEFDIIIYTRLNKLSHFSMYVGNLKILDLRENFSSVLRHFNDTQRDNIEGIMRHKQLVT